LPHHGGVRILLRAGAEITSLALGVVSTLWVSRAIGPTFFGYYAVMLTIVAMGGLLINAGLSTAGSQRIANDPDDAGQVAWVVTVSRALIALVSIVAGLVVLALAPIDPVLRDYLRIGLLVWALMPFKSEWILVARSRLRSLSGLRVAGSVSTLIATVALIHGQADAGLVAWIPVIGTGLTAAGGTFIAYRAAPFRRPVGTPVAGAIRRYLHDGLHYLKSDVSVFIFTSSDRLFLYVFAAPAVVGLYAAAYNVIQPFYAISGVIGDAMYLSLAQSFGTDRLRLTLRRYVDLMCFATVPLGFFLLAFAPTVIDILYGSKFAGASEYLAILGWVITFGYTAGVAVTPFSAWNLPREYGNSTALGGAVNIVLNFALIPPFGGYGAAWATVAAKVAVMLAALRYFRRATDYPLVRDFGEYLAISGIAFAAAIVGRQAISDLRGVPGIILFGIVYTSLVALIRWRRYRQASPTRSDLHLAGRPDSP
jgi:O-antigen/teichoic acid export membrane protein